MTTLETLFSPMQKEKLRQAAWGRTSCRSFAGAPDTAAFAALSYVVGRCALPGARLVLTPVDESLFTGTILGMGRITGCKMAAVVIACGTEALCRVNAGILGEAFVLEATALGLGTCWGSGTDSAAPPRATAPPPADAGERNGTRGDCGRCAGEAASSAGESPPEAARQADERRSRGWHDAGCGEAGANRAVGNEHAAVADGSAARSGCADHQRPCPAGRRHCAMPRGTGAARGTSVGVQRGTRGNHGGGAGEVFPLMESIGVRVLA